MRTVFTPTLSQLFPSGWRDPPDNHLSLVATPHAASRAPGAAWLRLAEASTPTQDWQQLSVKHCVMGFTWILETTLSLFRLVLPCLSHAIKAHGVSHSSLLHPSRKPQSLPALQEGDRVYDGAMKHALHWLWRGVTGKHFLSRGRRRGRAQVVPVAAGKWGTSCACRPVFPVQIIFKWQAGGLCGTR